MTIDRKGLRETANPQLYCSARNSLVPFQKARNLTVKKSLIFLIRLYQLILSPLFPPSCRYSPTCSHYAIEAISRHGAMHGLYLSIRRILRCHPFSKGGFDPVDL